MNVFDGDPIELSWRVSPYERTVMKVFVSRSGLLEDPVISRFLPPTDEEFTAFVSATRNISVDAKSKRAFMVLERTKDGCDPQIMPFAQFDNGRLVAFCRPPWRKGERM